MSPPLRPPLEGTAYRALARIGAGGMGEVWDAAHIELGKRVVVKVLRAQHVPDKTHVERFRTEARVLALLSHPNIVNVTDFGWIGQQPYLVMERVEGRTLAEETRARGALPMAEVLAIGRQLLAGLDAAHRAGIIHRDVKPSNVLYGPHHGRGERSAERAVVLVDFGLVKQLHRADASMTAAGTVMGTPAYFAPEQASGGRVDARTDLYSVGAVLYRLVTGRGPFDHHKRLAAMAKAHLTEKPRPPSHFVPGLPPLLDAVILRALAKKPERRFASAAEMAEALRACEGSVTPSFEKADPPAASPVRELPALVDTSGSLVVPTLPSAGRTLSRLVDLGPLWLGAILLMLSVVASAFVVDLWGRLR